MPPSSSGDPPIEYTLLSRSRSALLVWVCPMPFSHMLFTNASLRASGSDFELISWRDFRAPLFITESFVATTNWSPKFPWNSSDLESTRSKAASSLGIECYMQMKNLNKRLYQGAGTQPCLRLAGSCISGLTGACAAGIPLLCFGRRLPAAGSPSVIWQAPMAQAPGEIPQAVQI